MEKILAIVSLFQNIYGRWLSRKLLAGAIAIASLVIVTSAMTGAMLVGSFYAAYLALLHSGIDQEKAFAIIGCLAGLTTLLLVAVTLRYLQRLRQAPRRLLMARAPKLSEVSDMMDAFLEGFMGTPAK